MSDVTILYFYYIHQKEKQVGRQDERRILTVVAGKAHQELMVLLPKWKTLSLILDSVPAALFSPILAL